MIDDANAKYKAIQAILLQHNKHVGISISIKSIRVHKYMKFRLFDGSSVVMKMISLQANGISSFE